MENIYIGQEIEVVFTDWLSIQWVSKFFYVNQVAEENEKNQSIDDKTMAMEFFFEARSKVKIQWDSESRGGKCEVNEVCSRANKFTTPETSFFSAVDTQFHPDNPNPWSSHLLRLPFFPKARSTLPLFRSHTPPVYASLFEFLISEASHVPTVTEECVSTFSA